VALAKWTVTFDAADPARLAEFWALALGYVERPVPDGFASWAQWLTHHGVPEEEWGDGAYLSDPSGNLPGISFLKVPEPKVAKNRMHIDVQAGGGRDAVPWEERWPRVLAAVEGLTAAGATVLAEVGLEGRPDHVVMADPEGNEFCVV
jgi:Glyoxalase-like domain